MILANQQIEVICPTEAIIPTEISQVTDSRGQQYTLTQLSDYAGNFSAQLSQKPLEMQFPASGPPPLFQDWSGLANDHDEPQHWTIPEDGNNESELMAPCLLNNWIHIGIYINPSLPAISLPFYMTAISSVGAIGFIWSTVYFPIPSPVPPFPVPFPISVFIPLSVMTGILC